MTYVIAEIGVNHNNNIKISKKIIDFCVREKVDAVKFQTFNAETLALKNTPKVKYQLKSKNDKESHFMMLKKLELSRKDHKHLLNYCKKKGIDFISTPYDVESAKFLNSLNVDAIKVASADLTDNFLHEYLSKTNKKIIISTGMSNMSEIKDTLKIYKKKIHNVSLLHCVSNYPCSFSSLNLNCLDNLKKFKCKIGFSDHSEGYMASILAISKGAKIIEKHITLNNQLSGPDHKSSLDLKNFKIFLDKIRQANVILGDSIKALQKEEKQMMKVSRKGLYFKNDLVAGKTIKKTDLIARRPFNGMKVSNYKSVINKKLKQNVFKNQPISLKLLKKK
tara:strand:- start:827 stop:1831 length:1005 start_codon:yes stop_codon:yes gene_type:complete